MIQQFIFQHRVYAIKRVIEGLDEGEEVVRFQTLMNIQFWIASVATDPLASEDIIKIARWILVPARSNQETQPSDQALLDQLCKKIYSGDLLLVEVKLPSPKPRFHECCASTIKKIDSVIGDAKLAAGFLCIAQVHSLCGSHTKLPVLAGYLNTAYYARKESTWRDFAGAVRGLRSLVLDTIRVLAFEEYEFKHPRSGDDPQNQSLLREYWKGIYEAANEQIPDQS